MITSLHPYPTHSIANAARQIHQGEDPWVAIGCFLHDWWCHTGNERWNLITEPPTPATRLDTQRWVVLCAAIVEELCLRTSLAPPQWTNQQDYFLRDPWFYYPQSSQREWLLLTTPETFKRRNIFIGGSVLDNKYELKSLFGSPSQQIVWSALELQNPCEKLLFSFSPRKWRVVVLIFVLYAQSAASVKNC